MHYFYTNIFIVSPVRYCAHITWTFSFFYVWGWNSVWNILYACQLLEICSDMRRGYKGEFSWALKQRLFEGILFRARILLWTSSDSRAVLETKVHFFTLGIQTHEFWQLYSWVLYLHLHHLQCEVICDTQYTLFLLPYTGMGYNKCSCCWTLTFLATLRCVCFSSSLDGAGSLLSVVGFRSLSSQWCEEGAKLPLFSEKLLAMQHVWNILLLWCKYSSTLYITALVTPVWHF